MVQHDTATLQATNQHTDKSTQRYLFIGPIGKQRLFIYHLLLIDHFISPFLVTCCIYVTIPFSEIL